MIYLIRPRLVTDLFNKPGIASLKELKQHSITFYHISLSDRREEKRMNFIKLGMLPNRILTWVQQ